MAGRVTNPLLTQLQDFVGEWEMQAAVDGQPIGGSALTTFTLLEEGAFLAQRAEWKPDESSPPEWVANAPFPVTTIVGLDDSSDTYWQLYADARGVFRVYQMSFDAGIWKLWRDAPGFRQRFSATFSQDRRTITGRWEKSPDGSTWEIDFDITYTKVG
jgi:hypothetical protein